jgi:hypothetical protein
MGNGTLSLSNQDSIFQISNSSQTLIIDGPTLSGRTGYNTAIVYVEGGAVEFLNGSISNNINSSSYTYGGGVYVNGGTFTMSGGTISNNTASSGGGVYIKDGTFTMSGGTISGNTASSGGGVFVLGSFTMTGGKISGNSTTSTGGGVFVGVTDSNNKAYIGSFEMSGGEISGNNTANSYSSSRGGGVYIGYNSTKNGFVSGSFSKTGGGVIYGSDEGTTLKNTANGDTSGHAVFYSTYNNQNYNHYSYYRDTTLNAGDNISTDTLPESATGSYDSTNWIKESEE